MRNRQDAGFLDLGHRSIEISSGLPGSAEVQIAPCRSLVGQAPRSTQTWHSAAGTQCMGTGTAQQGGCQPDESNPFTEGLSHAVRAAAALVRLSLPDSGPPFAHLGHTLGGLGRSRQPQRKSPPAPNRPETLTNAEFRCTPDLQHRHHRASAQPCSPSTPDIDSALSGAQPDRPQQMRKRRRRSSVPFACASVGAAASPGASASKPAGASADTSAGTDDDSPPEWRWPQLPKWKPPRYKKIFLCATYLNRHLVRSFRPEQRHAAVCRNAFAVSSVS